MRVAAGDPVPPILAAILVVGLAVQLLLPPAPPPVSPPLRPARLPLAATQTGAMSPAYPAILARPLFSPTRSGEAVAGPAAPAGAFALLGVASDGRRAIASVRDPAGEVVTLRLGERLQGWRLETVGHDHAVLSLGGASQTLRVGAATVPLPGAGG